jgi:glycosyltransferase involved in cell wall biosynthesis
VDTRNLLHEKSDLEWSNPVKTAKSGKVALFLSYLGGGGAERVMLNLAEGFSQQGLRVDLILAKAWGPHLHKVPKFIRVIDLNASRPLLSLPKLVSYLRREQPLALISGMHYANEIAICAKYLAGVTTRIIVTEHNTLSRSLRFWIGMKRKLIPLTTRYLYPLADTVVAVSQNASKDLKQFVQVPEGKIKAIYNPVITPDLYEKAKAPLDHPWFQPGELPVILGVGKLERQKDFPTLIKAFSKVRSQVPCRLAILGWGPDQVDLDSLIKDLGLTEDAALLGYADNPYAYMARSSTFVLSSAWEGLPTVLIEAMALGIPVVSTNCQSGPEEILDQGKYGHLVPVGDKDAMAQSILAVLRGNHPVVNKIWLEQFELKNSVGAYLELIMACTQTALSNSPAA